MPPLYKRYIPPKPNASVDQAPTVVDQAATQSVRSNDDNGPKKRKRERTDEEIAERKAKKLKKKGTNGGNASIANHEKQASPGADKSLDKAATKLTEEPRSEFAHIKDTKKRHKLEKEARKARIAVEKAEKDDAIADVEPKADVRSKSPEQPRSQNGDGIQTRKITKEGKRRQDEVVESEAVEDSSLAQVTPVDRLKESKKKKSRQKDRDESNGIAGLPDDEATALKLQSEEALPQPRKRRHKLENVMNEPDNDSIVRESDDDSHLKKHGSILKKYQKSAERSQLAPKPAPKEKDPDQPEPVLLDLAPLPQPEPAAIEKFVPDDSALPAWLAKPTVISGDTSEPFASLDLGPKTTNHLNKLGFHDLLPVQKALIPMLLPPGSQGAHFLPGTESVLPDIAVGAPTGSGKTIAYLLPILESIKSAPRTGDSRLRALIIVPTRELVMQVAAVAESLAKGSSVKVGMATGSSAFKDEQAKLIKRDRKYDPDAYRALIAKADRRNYPPTDEDSEEFEQYLEEVENDDEKTEQRIQDAVRGLVDHVPTYHSAVDILVATPGRLLDHLKSTLGFSLSHLEFLVLDEADKLLDLQYDGFLETVNTELERPRHEDEQDVRERLLRSEGMWDERHERRVRKVVLSATMTRDISKLVALKLSRPRMILVRGAEGQQDDAEAGASKQDGGSFELPPTLREYCVPVGDGSEKPLFLVELLRTKILDVASYLATHGSTNEGAALDATRDSEESSSDSDYSSDSDSESDSSGDSSSSSSDSSDSSSPENEDAPNAPEGNDEPSTQIHPSRATMLHTASAPTILIFTSSNEAASRLTHFLKSLLPSAMSADNIHTLTRQSSKPKISSSATDPVVVISTDRAGRGLDAIGTRQITHVIQYDVPRSLTAYVHRVGRTARAGREGEAWTLYGHSEARWFFKEVAGDGKGVKRSGNVERVKISVEDEEMRGRLAEVVEEVRRKVFERR